MSLKDNILAALETSRDIALSGQALAEGMQVSRNAVWKAVNSLKEEGYAIESTPNRGYRLSPDFDRASEAGIQRLLATPVMPVHHFETLDSTNNEAKRRLAAGEPAPFVIIAEAQTSGRGRRSRTFYSPSGVGLYMSVALASGQAVEGALGITAYAAVCVAEAVQSVTGKVALIKWVNDLFLEDRKICGILTEATSDLETGMVESLVVGIGLNLRPSPAPKPLGDIIGSLECSAPVKNQLVAKIAHALIQYRADQVDYLEAYRARSLTLGRKVECVQGNESFIGTAIAIDAHGALRVSGEDGSLHTLRSGEARLLP